MTRLAIHDPRGPKLESTYALQVILCWNHDCCCLFSNLKNEICEIESNRRILDLFERHLRNQVARMSQLIVLISLIFDFVIALNWTKCRYLLDPRMAAFESLMRCVSEPCAAVRIVHIFVFFFVCFFFVFKCIVYVLVDSRSVVRWGACAGYSRHRVSSHITRKFYGCFCDSLSLVFVFVEIMHCFFFRFIIGSMELASRITLSISNIK